MTDTVLQTFCERCGRRYTFTEPASRSGASKPKLGLFGKRPADEPSEPVVSTTLPSSGRFEGSFHFCLECRQYTCLECWNEEAGQCLGCRPRDAAWPGPGVTTATGTGAARAGTSSSPDDAATRTKVARASAAAAGDLAWPSGDLERRKYAGAAATTGAQPPGTSTGGDMRPSVEGGGVSDASERPGSSTWKRGAVAADGAETSTDDAVLTAPRATDVWGRPIVESPDSTPGTGAAAGEVDAPAADAPTKPALDPWRGVVFSAHEVAERAADAPSSTRDDPSLAAPGSAAAGVPGDRAPAPRVADADDAPVAPAAGLGASPARVSAKAAEPAWPEADTRRTTFTPVATLATTPDSAGPTPPPIAKAPPQTSIPHAALDEGASPSAPDARETGERPGALDELREPGDDVPRRTVADSTPGAQVVQLAARGDPGARLATHEAVEDGERQGELVTVPDPPTSSPGGNPVEVPPGDPAVDARVDIAEERPAVARTPGWEVETSEGLARIDSPVETGLVEDGAPEPPSTAVDDPAAVAVPAALPFAAAAAALEPPVDVPESGPVEEAPSSPADPQSEGPVDVAARAPEVQLVEAELPPHLSPIEDLEAFRFDVTSPSEPSLPHEPTMPQEPAPRGGGADDAPPPVHAPREPAPTPAWDMDAPTGPFGRPYEAGPPLPPPPPAQTRPLHAPGAWRPDAGAAQHGVPPPPPAPTAPMQQARPPVPGAPGAGPGLVAGPVARPGSPPPHGFPAPAAPSARGTTVAPNARPTTHACPNCGLPLSAKARFCRRCGAPQA